MVETRMDDGREKLEDDGEDMRESGASEERKQRSDHNE